MFSLRLTSYCSSIIRSVFFMTTLVASSEPREDRHNVWSYCPYTAHASTAYISQKSGMSLPSLGSGWSSSSSTPLVCSHVGLPMSKQDALLRLPAVGSMLWRLCGAFVFLLWHARLSKTFRLMLPCSSHFVIWLPVLLFFLVGQGLPVNALALHSRPTPIVAVVTPSPTLTSVIPVMFRRQSNSADPTTPTSSDVLSLTSDLPSFSSSSDTATSVGNSISVVLSVSDGITSLSTIVVPSLQSSILNPSSGSSSQPTSQSTSEPTSSLPNTTVTSQPTLQPPSSSPTSQTTSSSPPNTQPPPSSSSIPPSSIPSSPPTSSTITSSNSTTVTTSSSSTLSISTSSSLSSSSRSETTVASSSILSGSLTSSSISPITSFIPSTSGSSATSSALPSSTLTPSTDPSTSILPSPTFLSSSDDPSTSPSATSSRPVLQPSPTLTSSDAPSSRSSAANSHFSTVLTTIVVTSTFSNQQGTGTTTLTTVVITGTLIPNQPNSGTNTNLLAHHPGAIAGVVIGSVAFAGLLIAWLFIARRRHQIAVREAEAAVLTSANSGGGGDAFGSGRARALFLDDDSRSMLHNTQPRMSQMYTGASIVRGSVEYGRLHSGLPEPQEIISPDNPPGLGGASATVNPQGDSPGTREDDAFMKNNSRMDVNEVEITPAQKSPMSYLSRASSGLSAPGPDPAAWLGNKDIIFTPVKTISPQPSTPGFGHSSSEGHVMSAIGSGSSDMVHLMPSQNDTVHSAGSLSGHGGGDIMSMSALPYAGGSGSSEHDQSPTGGSSSGHGGGSSSQGHAASSGGSHGHRPSEGRKSPGPSSLLPTQTQTQHPPIAFRNVEDEKKSRRRSFLGRPLKWRIRGGRPSSSSSMSSISNYSQPSPAPTLSFSDRRPLSAEMSMQGPPATHSVSRSSSIRRSHTPTLSSLPPPLLHVHTMFQPHEVDIPEDQVPPEAPHWPVFGNPAMPSPAWTDRSSQNLPDGLLDPRLGVRLGTGGASGSSAAISLRDDQDYSRPIGGFVNNRMYSTTTIPTVDTQGSHYTTSRRNSDESHQTRRFEADTDTPQEEFIAI